jgi:hypothetical protein
VGLDDAAVAIARMAEERPKADADRDPAYQERNWTRLAQDTESMQRRYDRGLDRALFKLALERAARIPARERPGIVAAVVGQGEPTAARIEAALGPIYDRTSLEDPAVRVKLLRTATLDDLRRSKDPMIELALRALPLHRAHEAREHAFEGALLLARPRYVEALQKLRAANGAALPLASDANKTLRITFGTVRGYRPAPEAAPFRPFTTLSELVKKDTGKRPFDAPAPLLASVRAKKFGPYADAALGEVPVDFLSDLDITGGNSGSATINARGELVGLAFDGNYEAMGSDWLFMPGITRTIHVDVRYVKWLLDAVYDGDHLLREMGAEPAIR